MTAAEELGREVGVALACRALEVSRATLYRRRQPVPESLSTRPTSHRALRAEEREEVLATLNSERFVDKAPAEVYATLLDEDTYLCSISTMYRLLRSCGLVQERRNQLRHPAYVKPELLATAPNQLWSWDITKLKGPAKWTTYQLYVVLDVYSRYVVGWMVAEKESAGLAKRLLAETIGKEEVDASKLVVHADRGTSMRSRLVAQLLADLGVTKTHSRPHVSDDNPFSESQFKTMKYRPEFPERFGSIEDARAFCRTFFRWYNEEHRHHGIALLTPAQVHQGRGDAVLAERQRALDSAYATNPHRFSRPPKVPVLAREVWINPPSPALGADAVPPSGVAEPPPEASVRPSPTRSVDREGEAQATERPEPPGPTRSVARRDDDGVSEAFLGAPREHGEDGEDATLPKPSPAVPGRGDGRMEAGEHPGLTSERQMM